MAKLLKRIIIINQGEPACASAKKRWIPWMTSAPEKTNRNTLIGLLENIPDYQLDCKHLTRLFMLMYYRLMRQKKPVDSLPVSNSRIKSQIFAADKLPPRFSK